jgi:GNAT superfamily N-acetyltransferase
MLAELHPGAAGHVTVRSAQAGDEALLRRIFANARAEEFAHLPGTDAVRRSIIDLQFAAQSSHFRGRYPGADHAVLSHRDTPVGRLVTDTTAGRIRLVDLTILGEHRGRGIGSTVLESLGSRADGAALPIELSVWSANDGAIRLYTRFGFSVEAGQAEDSGYLSMYRLPRTSEEASID